MSKSARNSFVNSIRGRLILLVLAITGPTAVLVALITVRAYRDERASVATHLLSTTRALATLVERKFDASDALLRGLESHPALEQDDLAAFETQVRKAVPGGDQWAVLVDASGRQLINTRLPRGSVLPHTGQEADFWHAMRHGQRHVSDVFVGATARQPVVGVSVPVMRNGTLKYALSLNMLPSVLAEALAVEKISRSEIISVIDRKGVVAARSRSADQFVGSKVYPDLIAAVTSRSSGVVESVTLDGVHTIAAFSRCPTLGWTAVMGAPSAEVYATAQSLLRVALTWSAILIGVAIFAAAWIWRSVGGGMELLMLDTEQLGAGILPPERRSGLREIDRVAVVLRGTAEKLKSREQDLQHLNETLELRVAARTAELGAANTALVSANRELDEFARVASHDLREPMRSISGFAEILRQEHAAQLDDEGRGHLERVCAATKRLSAMLDAILAYSKASSAPMAPFAAVNLNSTLAEVQQDCAPRLSGSGGRIEAGALGSVHGDARQLYQLLLNLISNGIKFHRPGVPPVVNVTTRQEGRFTHLVVEDNGIGFPAGAAEKIFVPFERMNRNYEGSGIGLAIVRRIAERHGGTVSATSTPGAGSRFEVILPLQPA